MKPLFLGGGTLWGLGRLTKAMIKFKFRGSMPETVVQPTSPNNGAAQGGELHEGLVQVAVLPVPVPPLGGGDGPPQPAGGGPIPGPQVTSLPEQSWQKA